MFDKKQCKFALEKNEVINEKVDKLKNGVIREVQYPDWLANVVVVWKKNENPIVCIDFTDLNKACLKDSFPQLKIDIMVDTTIRHELLSFMDSYSSYNQIMMHLNNQVKTSFVTEYNIFVIQVLIGAMNLSL